MRFELWSVFALAAVLASLTPGPAVLLVAGTALAQGVRRGLWTIAGILTANCLYLAGAAVGLRAIQALSGSLFTWIQWIGAAYLVWLGARMLLARGTGLELVAPGDAAARPQVSPRRMFGAAFLLQVTNPKAYVYTTAILPQFVEPDRPWIPQMAVITATSLASEIVVLGGYAVLAARARKLELGPGFTGWANRASGVALIFAGLLVAMVDWL